MYIVYVKSDILTNWINGPIFLGTNAVHLSGVHCIYVGMYVCRGPKSVGGNTWAKRAHAQSQYWAVKSDQ